MPDRLTGRVHNVRETHMHTGSKTQMQIKQHVTIPYSKKSSHTNTHTQYLRELTTSTPWGASEGHQLMLTEWGGGVEGLIRGRIKMEIKKTDGK